MFTLTKDNYYSPAASRMYMGVSQFKGFMKCAAHQKAKLDNAWVDTESPTFIGGRYAHARILEPHTVGEFEKYIYKENPMTVPQLKEFAAEKGVCLKGCKAKADIIDRLADANWPPPEGEKTVYSAYRWVDRAVETFNRMPTLKSKLDGNRQEFMVKFKLGGIWWKSLIDSADLKAKHFYDLKFMRNFEDKYSHDLGRKVEWWELFDYGLQMAVYAYAMLQEFDQFFVPNIIGLTKPDDKRPHSDVDWIQFSDPVYLGQKIEEVESKVALVQSWKDGSVPAPRCGRCNYCLKTKNIHTPRYVSSAQPELEF